jgi:hypothetical protein
MMALGSFALWGTLLFLVVRRIALRAEAQSRQRYAEDLANAATRRADEIMSQQLGPEPVEQNVLVRKVREYEDVRRRVERLKRQDSGGARS